MKTTERFSRPSTHSLRKLVGVESWRSWLPCAGLALLMAALAASAQTNVLISEFMASNSSTLADEDGSFEDWIEIYNAGTNTVDLTGWFLRAGGTSWQFPQTNIQANSFMIIFASNKNRRIPGRPLHTNFKLSRNGESLALIYPDGVTVASGYLPSYPIQGTDISYGLAVVQTPVTLISTGAPATFLVPAAGSFDTAWTQPEYDDSAWIGVTNGIGFETDPPLPFAPVTLADSAAEFSSTQGSNNWFYGYWDKTSDTNGIYEPANDFVPFPRRAGTVLSPTNFWNGTNWDWPAGNPPWIEITSTGGRPSGSNGNPAATNHWAIRRWVSETNGRLRITGTLACSSQSGTCGDGVVGRILVDGTEVFSRTVFGTSVGYSIIVSANVGSLIDFAIDAGAANNDTCDSTVFTAVIRTAGDSAIVADSYADWSVTGAQGAGSWFYGYWVKTNSTYLYNQFVPFPASTGPQSAANFWDGTQWHWFNGDPPFDTLGQLLTRPNLYPSGGSDSLEHWVIRRWISQISGQITIDWHFAKMDLTGEGTVARVFRNGIQIDTISLTAADFNGTTKTIAPFAVQTGDAIDFTVEPGASTPSPNSIGDICFLNAIISGSTTVSNQFLTDVGAAMHNVSSSAYLRIPFVMTNVLGVQAVTLRLKYDDGAVVYLNGAPVATRNAPDVPASDSAATVSRLDAEASQYEEISLTLASGLLRAGTNVLAIQGLNSTASDGDFLIVAGLRATLVNIDPSTHVYFTAPTPGALNGVGSATLGPLILDVAHTPNDPTDDQDIVVTARVLPTLRPIAAVQLYYRVMFGSESNVVMLDDGLHGDGAAGDGVYGAAIPNSISTPGQLVRYYITAVDSQNNLMRQPPFPDPNYSARYFGTVVQDPALTNPLPVLHLFITDANLASANSDSLGRYLCSIYYLGELYDNVGINLHGQSSAGFPQKSYDVDFDPDHHFRWDPNEARVSDINLLSMYPDKSQMRNILAYGTYQDAGSPYHFTSPVRVQSNGGFFGDWCIVENGGNDFLKRIGRDPNGALYKMYVTFTTPSDANLGVNVNAEKKTRKYEGNADLVALYNAVNVSNASFRVTYMYDNIDISEMLNMLAARSVTSDWDCCHKNYYFYRDSDNTGEWQGFPWDVDLSFGRNWSSSQTYWDDAVYPGNRIWGNWDNNGCFQVVLNMPAGRGVDATHQMYLRRCRTLVDELQQTNGTPAAQLRYERQIDQLVPLLAPDAALHLAKWGTWGGGQTGIFNTNSPYWRTLPQSVLEMKTNYMVGRRAFIFNQFMGLVGGDLTNFTNSQPTNVTIQIGALEYSPASGNQAEEYIQLLNTNRIAVDISGWTLAGAVEHTFQGGVVIPSGSLVYVVPDKKAFRSRKAAPHAGMNLYVEGGYKGQLSAQGDTLQLVDKTGRIVATTNYIGNPSLPQRYLRITEIMYHPPVPPSGSPYADSDFEYIELKNIGPAPLDLTGVHFTNGITFAFTGSSVTTLGATQTVLIVRNLAAFTSRYGSGFNIAGQYLGSLNNGGEKIEIDDAVGDIILVFSYDNKWYPITDGPGASLVIRDETTWWRTWSDQASWRPSAYDGGSPGVGDLPQVVVQPVLVNEVLSHSVPPMIDEIELYNPGGSDVNIGGWFISDDFNKPKKFRIPDGFIIPAGGYAVFDETQFNPTNPPTPVSFAFSSQGDEAYLFSGDAHTNLTGYVHGFQFGAAEADVSFGRYMTSVGAEHFVAQSARTFGATNAGPKVGPVVINELMFHPPDLVGGIDNVRDEYIELYNITANAVPLFDPAAPTNTWHLRKAVDFDFPTNVVLPAGGYLLVVSFDPSVASSIAAFRARYGLSPSLPVYGPYSGKLNNGGDTVELHKPDPPVAGNPPYFLVDRFEYVNSAAWALADGIGGSLQRRHAAEYGDDPINWVSVAPTPGTAFLGGVAPVITSQPGDLVTPTGRNLLLSVTATGTAPLNYQWTLNGFDIPGANSSTLSLPNFQSTDAGVYNVRIYNGGGFVTGTNFTIGTRVGLQITAQPANRTVTNGSPAATFSVAAIGTGTLHYQWSFSGGPILNASNGTTSATLVLTNVQLAQGGAYSCTVGDDFDSTNTQPATLTVLIPPRFVLQPLSQSAVAGGSVTFSVLISGTPPFSIRWRRPTQLTNGFFNGFIVSGSNYSFLTLTNLNATNAVTYTVAVSNLIGNQALGGSQPGLSSNAVLTVLADTDGDGFPDIYETNSALHPCLTLDPNNPMDGLRDLLHDFDQDGMSDIDEYIAGTDPCDAANKLKEVLSTGPSGTTVQFSAVSNRTYTVQYVDGLASPANSWKRLADIVARGTNHTESILDPASTTNRFYRVVTPFQP